MNPHTGQEIPVHKKGEADKGVAHPLTSVNFISVHFIIARDGTRQQSHQ